MGNPFPRMAQTSGSRHLALTKNKGPNALKAGLAYSQDAHPPLSRIGYPTLPRGWSSPKLRPPRWNETVRNNIGYDAPTLSKWRRYCEFYGGWITQTVLKTNKTNESPGSFHWPSRSSQSDVQIFLVTTRGVLHDFIEPSAHCANLVGIEKTVLCGHCRS